MDVEIALGKAAAPQYPFVFNDTLYWLESLPDQGGRVCVMKQSNRADPVPVTPEGFNIRTRVNEYGGKCFCLCGQWLIFNNYDDGNLYFQDLDSDENPVLLVHGNDNSNCIGFADLVWSPDCEWVIAIRETSHPGVENRSEIVAVSVAMLGSGSSDLLPPVILKTGSDFYASPVISPRAEKLAWIEWSHPNMPWDQSRLVWGDLNQANGKLGLSGCEVVVDEPQRAVCQPGFTGNGRLIFASDSLACNFWNLFSWHNGRLVQVTDQQYEFGEAHWVFGQRRWLQITPGSLLAIVTRPDGDRVVEVDISSGQCRAVSDLFTNLAHISQGSSGFVNLVASYVDRNPEVVTMDCQAHSNYLHNTGATDSIRAHSDPLFFEFETTEHDVAYGYFYPPWNPQYSGLDHTLPPAIVMIHGGPTARTTREYAGLKQYYCSLGYAVIDINHRGSTGFGREFRQSLIGNWGEYDCDDIRAAIDHAARKQWIDMELVFIRGSSAGGYAVLRALTQYPEVFCGGASYYGIGNLITLSELTHKFESRYTDQLLGESFDPIRSRQDGSRYRSRSPVFAMQNIACPLILFQGEQDRIVPREIAYEIIDLLKVKGINYSYTEYPGEGHGFRSNETRIDAIQKETQFFADIIRAKTGLAVQQPGNYSDRPHA